MHAGPGRNNLSHSPKNASKLIYINYLQCLLSNRHEMLHNIYKNGGQNSTWTLLISGRVNTLQENSAFSTARIGRKWFVSVSFEVISDRIPTDRIGPLNRVGNDKSVRNESHYRLTSDRRSVMCFHFRKIWPHMWFGIHVEHTCTDTKLTNKWSGITRSETCSVL